MNVEVNYLAVLLATVSSMIVGWIWYSKSVFGAAWMKSAGLTEEKLRKGGWAPMVWAFALSLLTAYVLAHVIFLANQFFDNSFLQDALSTAFWVWLGFVATRLLMHSVFELRSAKFSVITLGNEFVTIMLMGLIIGWLGV